MLKLLRPICQIFKSMVWEGVGFHFYAIIHMKGNFYFIMTAKLRI